MHSVPIVFDLTRLIGRLRHASPSGIDRVDLAYARHLLEGGGARFGLVATPLGPRILDRDGVGAVVAAVAAGWEEAASAEADPVYRGLSARLRGEVPAEEAGAARRGRGRRRLQAALTARALRGPSAAALPRGAVYLHTSHMGLERPARFDWLHDRPDVRALFFVHDLIPISHPEFGRAGEAERHAARMRTVLRHAAHVIVNSADVGARFEAHAAGQGVRCPPVSPVPLGVEPAFAPPDRPPAAPDRPTFLVCGTVEARKNHLLLLQVWRDLAVRLGPDTPRLVVAGRRGWEAENACDLLDRCAILRPHLIEVAGLSTPGLARLMQGATALLMPSFAEGYGLPVVEAAACGLPVVASDLPVHREIGEGFAGFVDPLDGPGWAAAVAALGAPGSGLRAAMRARLSGYRPPRWPEHFARVIEAIDRAAA